MSEQVKEFWRAYYEHAFTYPDGRDTSWITASCPSPTREIALERISVKLKAGLIRNARLQRVREIILSEEVIGGSNE